LTPRTYPLKIQTTLFIWRGLHDHGGNEVRVWEELQGSPFMGCVDRPQFEVWCRRWREWRHELLTG
jgi:hypothetical protein